MSVYFSPRSFHLSVTTDKFAILTCKNARQYWKFSWRPVSVFFMKGTESKAILYRAACVSICVAGMTSVSLCWDRKILSHRHCHKSNTIMKWHHIGSVIKWAVCCLGTFMRRMENMVSVNAALKLRSCWVWNSLIYYHGFFYKNTFCIVLPSWFDLNVYIQTYRLFYTLIYL